ncbi:hypothetical protein BG003_005639, partial [Podila horticola]
MATFNPFVVFALAGSHPQHSSPEVEGLISSFRQFVHDGAESIVNVTHVLEKLRAIKPDQQVYIMEQVISKTFGHESPIDDRQ